MTSLRPFSMFDLLKFNNVNLDLLTETYNNRFYGNYLSEWPNTAELLNPQVEKFKAIS